MKGKVIIVVGKKGSGKSTVLKNMIWDSSNNKLKVPKEKLYIFDPFGDYSHILPSTETNFKKFITSIKDVKNSVISIDEATIYLGHWKIWDMQELLVRARMHNNIILLVFHSFTDLPKYVYRLGNIIVVKKTVENREKVENIGDEKLLKIWDFVNKSDNEYEEYFYQYA